MPAKFEVDAPMKRYENSPQGTADDGKNAYFVPVVRKCSTNLWDFVPMESEELVPRQTKTRGRPGFKLICRG